MSWVHPLVQTVAVVAIISPSNASGHHISCQFSGVVEQKSAKIDVSRILEFYLDDSGEKLVPEGGGQFPLSARTTLYADTEIDAEINDGGLTGGDLFLFKNVIQPPAILHISRTTGRATIVAKLAPAGADVEMADCHETSPPPTKF